MSKYAFFSLFSCFILCLSLPTVANERIQCPEKLAIIQNDRIVEAALSTFKALYSQLGCSPTFSEFPGRRGVLHFNESLVDGEFYRIPMVEGKYSRPFVRSAVPLFQLSNELWLHPDEVVRDRLPIGYILGVVWQEEYMKNRHGVAFSSGRKMFSFYQKGRISGFLSSSNPVIPQAERSSLQPAPVLRERISTLSLYHYLGIEHADFMKKLSELLVRDNPFDRKNGQP